MLGIAASDNLAAFGLVSRRIKMSTKFQRNYLFREDDDFAHFSETWAVSRLSDSFVTYDKIEGPSKK
jgi:hypothetical protein